MNKIFYILIILVFSCKSKKTNNKDEVINLDTIILNVKDFGAKGNFIQDDTKAIQACFYALAKKGGGVAYFPNGVYKISRTSISGKAWCLKGISNITIKGESKVNTVIKLEKAQKNFTRMLVLEGTNNININNITFNGNLENQLNPQKPNEHLGGIFIDHSNNITIRNVNFINTGGDGLSIRGVKIPSKNIHISHCFFDYNMRNGLTLGSGFDGVVIKDNIFGKNIDDSPIDTEPNSGICRNVVIENNLLNTPTLLTLGGPSTKNKGFNFKLINNTLIDCSIFMIYADSVLIKKNKIINSFNKKATITCQNGNNRIYITKNEIKATNKPAFYLVKTQLSSGEPNTININNNTVNVIGKTNAFDVRGANNVYISNNIIHGKNSNTAIYCFSNYQMDNININNNTIDGFTTGIKINPLKNKSIYNINIKDNTFQQNIKTAIDYKYHGRKELNLLKNLKINNNIFSKKIKVTINN